MKIKKDRYKFQTMAAFADMLAPVRYIGMVILLGLLEPGYNQRTMVVSNLAVYRVGGARPSTLV